jgi:uncharacterized OsmC-like protein
VVEKEFNMSATQVSKSPVNGIDVTALEETADAIQKDPRKGIVAFEVETNWTGQTSSESVVKSYTLGGVKHSRSFAIRADEPHELLGSNGAPNPQELLMSAVNACMMVGYVAGAAIRGINLRECVIHTTGELDLRGFLGLDANVAPGYQRLDYTVRLSGDGTREQYEDIHEAVMATSPNFFNMSKPIPMHGRLETS